MLSKSRYTRGVNCHKSLWLYVHKRDEQVIPDFTQTIFAMGTSAGELAREYFPGGKLAMLEDFPGYASAKRTQEFIRLGVETIYEATFIYDNTLVAVDILHKQDGKWQVYEVKSTNSVKPEHIKDVAIQYYVVKGSGLDLSDAFLMHFNRDYVRHGEIEVNKLYLPESIHDEVLALQGDIINKIPGLLEMIKGEEPEIPMGLQCTKPYYCDFYDYCSKLLPLIEEEPGELSAIPEIQDENLKEFLDGIQYPLYYLDFETIMSGVPLFDESRPYQQITFQYSLHHRDAKGGEVMHEEYLAESNLSIDPRKALIEQMIAQTKPAKTILMYTAFERTRIKEMQRDFPQYENELQSIIDRLYDLAIPFRREHYSTETMEGSYSIKVVLPALCPECSYDDLEISDGMAASSAFMELYYCNDNDHIRKTRENLLEYCHLDTLAMVKILEKLYQSVEG